VTKTETKHIDRRDLLQKAGLVGFGALLGAVIPFERFLPDNMIPIALGKAGTPAIPGKHGGLLLLNDRPINAETPAHLLDDDVTPADKMFVRNNGIPPKDIEPSKWTLEIGGESIQAAKTFSLRDLKEKFEHHTLQITIECGGNGRSEFYPPARGNQWTLGAVGCPEWTGVRLRDVLDDCGVKKNAVYVGYYGADLHPSNDPAKVVISRGVPIANGLEDETLIAWAMNGDDMPILNGHPLRLVCGGFPGSASGKWLKRIVVRDKVHDGPKMTGKSYRVPCKPSAPGEKIADKDLCIIEQMPVKSLITRPKSGIVHSSGGELAVRGHAWASNGDIQAVHVSIDFGQTWQPCQLKAPKNRFAWQRWNASVSFPQHGYYEIWARATDAEGRMQPMVLPGWNPKGYLNNACHRIAVRVA